MTDVAITYASRDDMIERFGELQIGELESTTDGTTDLTKTALHDATVMINGYLSVRYRLPLIKSPDLKLHCSNIARYLMYFGEPTDEVEARYKEAISWLKDVAKGNANIMFNEPLTDADESKAYRPPVVAIGDSYEGSVFGDAVFAKMPSVGGSWN